MRKGSEGECAMPLGMEGTRQTRATRAGRGDNHAGRRGAMGAALLGGALLLLPATPRAQAVEVPGAFAESPLVQRNVPAEATAENAVVARDRALAAGQRLAYERMAEAMGLPPAATDSQIEAMVSSLVIESERITPRGYSARITVNFNPAGAVGPRLPEAPPPTGAAVTSVEAMARYRSFGEYLDLTRRLAAQPAVARVEVVAISGEAARLRLGLRSTPEVAAAELAQGGLLLGQGGEGWRLGLAGAR